MRHKNPAGVKARWRVACFLTFAALGSSFRLAAGISQAETEVSPEATPEISQVKPNQAAVAGEVTFTIAGRNFSRGVYVSFTNPALHVVSTRRISATQLEARLAIGSKAAAGPVSLFVSNPASSVAEAPFTISGAPAPAAPKAEIAPTEPGMPEVAGGSPAAPPTPAPALATTPTPAATAGSATQRFQVYNLGDVVSILQSANKPKGTLAVSGGKLSYQEGDKEVFSVALGEVKEIDVNTLLGVTTGTFHVILNAGTTYNFVAASLRPAETQSIVDSLRRALPGR